MLIARWSNLNRSATMPANSCTGASCSANSQPGIHRGQAVGAHVRSGCSKAPVARGLLLTAYLTAPVNGGVSRLTPNPYQSSF